MSARIVDYQTVSSRDAASLDKCVWRQLQDGWELYGSPYSNENQLYNQAMVKRAAPDNGERFPDEPEPPGVSYSFGQ